CQKMRDAGHTFPVLMLTARDTNTDKVIGLDAGADDYMVKPFDLLELLARLRALLRRSSGQVSRVLSWERLRLDPSTYEVSYAERSLHLTRKEFCLLELLLRNGRRILTRSAMIDGCWSMAVPPEEETVKAHLKTLRQKLRQVGAPDPFIETVRGVGYRLNDM
ncbi:MAG: response regulator transcription factor, partial [Cyanobacteria bacterium J06642_2]